MNPNRVNEFLPMEATPDRMNSGDEEFDLARYQALKRELAEEKNRLIEEYQQEDAKLDMQSQARTQQLLSQVQHKVHESMQKILADLQSSIAATVDDQVVIQLQKEDLRKQHDTSIADSMQRHFTKIQHMVTSDDSNRSAKPHAYGWGGRESSILNSHHFPQPMPAELGAPEFVPSQRKSRKLQTSSQPDVQAQRENGTEVPENAPGTPRTKHSKAERAPKDQKDAQDSKDAKYLKGSTDAKDPTDEKAREDSTATPRQDAKRKAVDSPTSDAAAIKKRQRNRDQMPRQEAENAAQTPPKQSTCAQEPLQFPPAVQRTLKFNEVYQDGKSQYKHQIFEYKAGSGNWYIVKCDEHDVHFKYGNPVHGAAKHVSSPQHGSRDKTHDLAIKLCGYLIPDCNAELAELNNREFRRALEEDGYAVHNRNLLTKAKTKPTSDERQKQPKSGKEGGEIHVNGDTASKRPKKQGLKAPKTGTVIQPKECHFYQGLWSSTKKYYCLIVLPIRPDGSLSEVGLRDKFQEVGLIDNAPKCYRVDRVSLQIKGWQAAYEDGGPKFNKREYPVMYFDKASPSLGWLQGQKLIPLDLDNPPEDIVDTKGLERARQWYAEKMNHRNSWAEFKELGPGEPPSATPNGEGTWAEQRSLLRSATRQDEDSPRRGLRGGESVDLDRSSDEESDDEDPDPMKMDIGPIPDPEAGDSNYVDSDTEGSIVRTRRTEAQQSEDEDNDEARPDSRRGSSRVEDVDVNMNGPVDERVDGAASHKDDPPQDPSKSSAYEPPHEKQHDGTNDTRESSISTIMPEHKHVRKSAQAKAVEAAKETASRSRTPSEVPPHDVSTPRKPAEQVFIAPWHQQPQESSDDQARPSVKRAVLWDHQRSRSDDVSSTKAVLEAPGMGKVNEGRKHSDIQSILNHPPATSSTGAETKENGPDSYKRFDALMAQMQNEQPARSSSAPIEPNAKPCQPPPPPPPPPLPVPQITPVEMQRQQAPAPLSRILSPPMKPVAMGPPGSASSTPVPGSSSGRSTPTFVYPGNSERWQAVRTPPLAATPQTSRASFVSTASAPASASASVPEPMTGVVNGNDTPHLAPSHHTVSIPAITPRADSQASSTEKKEIFDVCHFRDLGRGVRWSRDGPTADYLRLTTDPAQGVAESTGREGFTAIIVPDKVARIDVEVDQERHRVQLALRDGSDQVVVFEVNSASGRMLSAKIQARRLVSWVKKCNPKVVGPD
ncbi:hypothetical protein VPNG_07093 [Cytospora leucostoma]|uniref:Uncharacterized protein n=1 Tax=Cytospora leucostoma TaxID=1230097 RepID=A0A423WVJ3_9PEZI|nr:hypothetical protein VPNG_07093 [Cytospora leucostoma]